MKKKHSNHHYIAYGLTAFFVIAASIFVYYLLFHASNFKNILEKFFILLMPIIDGLVLAYLLTPLVNFFEKKVLQPFCGRFKKELSDGFKKVLRYLSILLTLAVVCFGVYGFFAMAIPQIINSIETILTQFPKYVDNTMNLLSGVLDDNPEIEQTVVDLVNRYSEELENLFNNTIMPSMNSFIVVLSSSVLSFVKAAWNLVIGFIISIYVLSSKEKFSAQFKKSFYAIFEIETANRFINNIRFTHKTMGGYFIGKILDSIIIGILCFIGTSLMNTPFSVLISVIIGITNIIPFFGPFLGAIPSALIIVMIDPLRALYFIIFILILQQVDGNIIGPKILGNSTGLSSFWVIFAITLFGGLFGILGMVIGVPVFAVVFAAIKSLVETKLREKDLPISTEKYLKLLYIDADDGMNMVEFDENDEKSPAEKTSRIRIKRENWMLKLKKEESQSDEKENTESKEE